MKTISVMKYHKANICIQEFNVNGNKLIAHHFKVRKDSSVVFE